MRDGAGVVLGGDGGAACAMEDGHLVQLEGSLWVVVREEWEEDAGFVVWELDLPGLQNGIPVTVLGPEQLVRVCRGRKWVHEPGLLDVAQMCKPTLALKDRGGTEVRLGVRGSRRFAPRLGIKGEMSEMVPVDHGHAWVQILDVSFTSFMDRTVKKIRSPTFVFSSEQALVESAYAKLRADDEVDEDDD